MSHNHLPAGHKLQNGKYKIIKAIGQGGFGITYRAETYTRVTGSLGGAKVKVPVAIKEFYFADYCTRDTDSQAVVTNAAIRGTSMFDQFKSKMIKEGAILSRLRHENIVSVIEIFEENNTAYIVMEYIDGRPLSDIVQSSQGGCLDIARAMRYASQLCYAVDTIHRGHVLHLDIKPGNILIDSNDEVKVIDFGISKQYDSTHTETSSTPVGISKGYAPVEQYSDVSHFSPATDIYAIGATVYYMLTGKVPQESIMRVSNDMLVAPAQINPAVPSHISDAVMRALSIKAQDRPASAADLSAAINQVPVQSDGEDRNDNSGDIKIPEIPGNSKSAPHNEDGNSGIHDGGTVINESSTDGTVVNEGDDVADEKTKKRPKFALLMMIIAPILLTVASIFTLDEDLVGVSLSLMVISNVVNVWSAMITPLSNVSSKKGLWLTTALVASLLYLFRYATGLDYYLFSSYNVEMLCSAWLSYAALLASFIGNGRRSAITSVVLIVLSLALFCMAGIGYH